MESQLKQQLDFVNNKYIRRIDEIDTRIAELKAEIEQRLAANAELETNVVSKASGDRSRFARIRNEQNGELAAYEEGKREELEIIAERAFTIDEEIFTRRNQQRTLQSEINHLTNQNQIYRLAMYFTGKESATEVKRRAVGVVALLWFGSLSLIAAICGVMLALAGFYLRRAVESGEE
jgi:chromosome segregation ATPase